MKSKPIIPTSCPKCPFRIYMGCSQLREGGVCEETWKAMEKYMKSIGWKKPAK
jgi:hypothetical protein